MSSLSDTDLMQRVGRGDLDALRVLFERHHARLFNLFCHLGHDRAVAEDLVQEVFLRLLRFRSRYRREGEFRFWLNRIARNVWLDQRRARGPRMLDESAFESHPMDEPLPSDFIEREEQAALVREALALLPESHREVLMLSRFEELPYDQIGRLLGCEVGAIKTRVHRALKQLRAAYLQLARVQRP